MSITIYISSLLITWRFVLGLGLRAFVLEIRWLPIPVVTELSVTNFKTMTKRSI